MSSAALAHPAGFSSLARCVARPAFRSREGQIGAAIAVSLLIHGVALGWLPGLTRQVHDATPLHVRLPSPTFLPATIAVPPAPTLAPTPRAPRSEATPRPHHPTPVLASTAPTAAAETSTFRVAEPIAAEATEMPRPIALSSPVRPSAPDAGMLAAYGRELAGAVATRQRYPRLAQLRQWQGTAVLQLELAAGELLAVRVLSSSGHEILDRQALEMVRAAIPLPRLPDALAGRLLTVDVPVVFRLAS